MIKSFCSYITANRTLSTPNAPSTVTQHVFNPDAPFFWLVTAGCVAVVGVAVGVTMPTPFPVVAVCAPTSLVNPVASTVAVIAAVCCVPTLPVDEGSGCGPLYMFPTSPLARV